MYDRELDQRLHAMHHQGVPGTGLSRSRRSGRTAW